VITLYCELVRDDEPYGTDQLVLRVAPWIALPNTQRAKRLFIAEMADGSNRASINGIKEFAKAAEVELQIIPPAVNRADRWLQDEIEIGFARTPAKTIPVVLDSPRNRELDDFPEKMLLGPDFGYVTRGNDELRSSLDSFGNLECTPPHTGPRGAYPFGRILFGGAQPGAQNARRMMKVVSDFMYAQQVQHPIELYSDWLNVGHIDEFMSFVPAPDGKKFRLVLASPETAYRILRELRDAGHGAVRLMPGKRHDVTIDALLDHGLLRKQNETFQSYIDWNKAVLLTEMGLTPSDIVYLPALYFAEGPRADAFFPGMVNMQVANGHLAIPKPFGPVVGGKCAFEKAAEEVFHPLKLKCHFIDTYEGYHLQMGEIHCGTNVVREPFMQPWWEFDPSVNQG
jgi:protein-arginine deiminase